ncbi:MAG: serine/threonine-protein kinase [Kofleriaceae bacterium]
MGICSSCGRFRPRSLFYMPPPPPVPDRTETLAPRESSSAVPPVVVEPDQIGVDDPERYEQVAEHARGGLGRVVRAVDRRLGRTVAVKELLRRTDSTETRFMREALITARLEHPGIVPVHEAGRWPNGDPYYVMKLVEGRTLKELIAERTSLRERSTLLPHVIAVADAVGYAHSEGVIHRDLKPSNVIVGAFGETIVVDWGLARDRKRDSFHSIDTTTTTEFGLDSTPGNVSTVSGKVVGTPAYMSPEQARGEPVDERVDVYAIGAVLYELLAGAPAHSADTPQATLERVLAGPPAPLATVMPAVPGELGTIVAKAMARDPKDRYPNATALAEDLRLYQAGKLVSAHSYTAWSLLRKKLSHHRGVVAVAVASAVALGAVGVESFRRVVAERNIARSERRRSEDALSQAEKRKRELVLLQAVTALRKDPTATVAWLKTYDIVDGDRGHVVDVVDEALALGVARHVFRPGDWVFDAVFTPDGTSLVAVARDSMVRSYNLHTGRVTQLGKAPSPPEVVEISPDGKLAVTGGTLGEVIAWPLDGSPSRTLIEGGSRMVGSLRFSADGRRVLAGGDSSLLESISVDGEARELIGDKTALRTRVADQDWTKQIVLTAPNAVAAVVGKGRRPLATTAKAINALAISPIGDQVVLHDGATVWMVPFDGGELRRIADFDGKVVAIRWSPDARTIAIAGHRTDIVLVDVETGETRELRGHTDALYSVQWTSDGRRLLSASDDGTARLWTISDGTSTVMRGHDDDVYRARLSSDERWIATASLDGSVRVWPVDSSGAKLFVEGGGIEQLTLEGDRALIKTAGTVSRWNLATAEREPLFSWAQDHASLGMGIPSRDGEELLVFGGDWSMEVRRRTSAPVGLVGHRGLISQVEFSRDGDTVFSSSFDGTLRRWDTSTGNDVRLIEGTTPVRGFAMAADGRMVAMVGDETWMIAANGQRSVLGKGGKWCVVAAEFDEVRDRMMIHRCDRSLAMVIGGHVIELAGGWMVTRVAVSPDGTKIAGAAGDRTVRIWDGTSGNQLSILRGHSDLVLDVAFSPDGRSLASASYDKTIRIWDLGSSRHRVLRGHSGAVDTVRWRDAEHLVSGARDGTLRLWDVPALELPSAAALAGQLSTATTATIELDRPITADGVAGAS